MQPHSEGEWHAFDTGKYERQNRISVLVQNGDDGKELVLRVNDATMEGVGAEVFATAGNPEKRAYLERLGIRHVFDSRSLDFHDQVIERLGVRTIAPTHGLPITDVAVTVPKVQQGLKQAALMPESGTNEKVAPAA